MDADSLINHFLLALPIQTDSYFEDSVTLLVKHNQEGAMGFIVNRPTPVSLKDVLVRVELKTKREVKGMMLEGGPVSRTFPSMIHTSEFSTDETFKVTVDISVTMQESHGGVYETLKAIAEGNGPQEYLFLLGYAGWGPGQLESELEDNAWVTCPADRQILFDEPFDSRLQKLSDQLNMDFDKFVFHGGDA